VIAALGRRPLTLVRTEGPVLALAALLVAWGNAASTVLAPTAVLPGGSWGYALTGIALAAISLLAARALALDGSALGLRGDPLRGVRLGLLLGTAGSLAGVAALRSVAPFVVGRAVDYAPLAGVGASELLWHVAALLPLGIVVPEEIAFRGVLVGAIARARGAWAAIVASSLLFAMWHGAVVFATVGDTTIGPGSPWSPVAVAGALAVIAVGGALLAWLRLTTGALVTTIAAHWAFNVVVLVGLWATQGR
jgi:membrane protease YdiL (CAAX protease family)